MRLSFLILTSVVVGILLPGPAKADKMHPEMMSHKRRPGLNAMASCRRPLFNICQGCSINIKMRVHRMGSAL